MGAEKMKLTKKSGILIGSISLLVVLAIVAAVILLNGGYPKVYGQSGEVAGAVSEAPSFVQAVHQPLVSHADGTVAFHFSANEVAKICCQQFLKNCTYFTITDRQTIEALLSHYEGVTFTAQEPSPDRIPLGGNDSLVCYDAAGNQLVTISIGSYTMQIGTQVYYNTEDPQSNTMDDRGKAVRAVMDGYMAAHTTDSGLQDYINKVQKIEYYYSADAGYHFNLDITRREDIEKILGLYASLPYFEMQTDDYRLDDFSSRIFCYDAEGNIIVALPTWEICYPQEKTFVRCPDLTARSKVNEQVKELMAQFVKEGTYTPYHYADEMIH